VRYQTCPHVTEGRRHGLLEASGASGTTSLYDSARAMFVFERLWRIHCDLSDILRCGDGVLGSWKRTVCGVSRSLGHGVCRGRASIAKELEGIGWGLGQRGIVETGQLQNRLAL
jgi:hypothetical protein